MSFYKCQTEEKQPTADLFNLLAPHITERWLLGAFRMRHEKHTQSSSIPEALALPHNAAAAANAKLESTVTYDLMLGHLQITTINL